MLTTIQKTLDLVDPVRLSSDDTQRKPSEFEGNNSNNCIRYISFKLGLLNTHLENFEI